MTARSIDQAPSGAPRPHIVLVVPRGEAVRNFLHSAILEHFHLDGFFDEIFGSSLDGNLADKHDLLRHVRGELAFAPAATALVGDRKYDVAAARALGVLSVGALWGYGSRAELEDAGADRLAETPESVLELLSA